MLLLDVIYGMVSGKPQHDTCPIILSHQYEKFLYKISPNVEHSCRFFPHLESHPFQLYLISQKQSWKLNNFTVNERTTLDNDWTTK